ncbi:MAG: enoyl-CoA hydratase/isomerase family protein [Chloroflexi bacterium]|nr:enoyl-CoA hydratase/isomerase family protein [Chloroflexota bacterium]
MDTTHFPSVVYEKAEAIAHVTLNRPRMINAYNVQMRDDLYQSFQAARDDPDVRVVILKGAGERGFCAGADLNDFGTAPSRIIARRARWGRDLWGLILSMEKPVIAALHGWVLGSGIEMSLCCDVRIASEDAVFGLPEVSLGIMPAAGGSQTLSRTINLGSALEMLLLCNRIDAWEAHRLGLVSEVTPRERLLARAEERARHLLTLEPAALQMTKRAVAQGLDVPLVDGLLLERRLHTALWQARAEKTT